MDKEYLTNLMRKVAEGNTKPEEAVEILKDLPFEDLGFANIDQHRNLRTGYPEAVFCQGKTPEQIAVSLTERILKQSERCFPMRNTIRRHV